jgi:hypothetical protein
MEEWKNGLGSWSVFDWITYLTLEWMAPYEVFPGFGGEDEGVVMWLCVMWFRQCRWRVLLVL